MAKLTDKQLLDDFERMLREHWTYVWGAAKTGQVDCSGAFVWSFDRHRKSIAHGANAIARGHVVKLIPYKTALADGLIVPGMAAFKRRTPDMAGYNLPDKYRTGGAAYNGDLNDYYHIGLVGRDTAQVLNAQGTKTGFVSSPITQNWTHVALLRAVEYNTQEEGPKMQQARVCGGRLKLRQDPSSTAKVLDLIPDGSVVEITGDSGNWMKVAWHGQDGYCMADFLVMLGSSEESESPEIPISTDGQTVTITLPMETALQLRDALIGALGLG